ncbi:MAG: hypothetical protein IJ213_08100 [Bacteroidales bacterium]|nr:hypothetical protein [Bacteroidales bacterium]MBQ9312988.1 hypothetical protein [Bacteroidales bacterium]
MKNLKKILLILVAVCAFAACGDDDNKKEKQPTTVTSVFNGDVYVDENLTASGIDVEIKTNTKDKKCDILMNNVKFSENMPMAMNMGIEGLTYTISGSDTIATGTAIHPTVSGQSFPSYTLNNILCTFSANAITIAMDVASQHGNMTMRFTGTRNK